MTRGAKEKIKLIEVKPVQADDRDHMLTFEESNVNASPGNGKMKVYKVNLLPAADNDLLACDDKSLSQDLKKEDVQEKNMQILIKDINNTGELKVKVENEINKTGPVQTNDMHNEQERTEYPGEIYGKKGKKKRKRGKKKKKEEKIKESESTSGSKCKTIEETPAEDEVAVNSESVKSENKGRKLPCLFGFISTWLAKRKERRRSKKRKAIEARSPTPEPLVEYEHKKARGGVAFTVEVDSRPMRKPVLPPIRQRPSPIVREIDDKLKHAQNKRSEELEKKKMSSKEYAKKKAECHDRKADKEFYFKQKVDLTIRHKQSGAQKNRARFQEERRCSTPILRAPSTLPPLRAARVKQAASTCCQGQTSRLHVLPGSNKPPPRAARVKQAATSDQKGINVAGLKNDPNDAIFDF